MKKNIITFLVIFFAVLCLTAREKIMVYREGEEFFVRSRYNAMYDIVIHTWNMANESAYLIKPEVSIRDTKKGTILYTSADAYPPVAFSGYSMLGGNHGSMYVRTLLFPGHGLTGKDIGGKITEKNGTCYIILGIPSPDKILIHSYAEPTSPKPFFQQHKDAELFYQGKPLNFQKSLPGQLYPVNRITKWELLADGVTPIPEKTIVKCDFVDFIFVHDILSPADIVRSVKENPGKIPAPGWQTEWKMMRVDTPELEKKYPAFMKIQTLATCSNRFRFEPRGANVNYRKTVYHIPLAEVSSLDVMFAWRGCFAWQKKDWLYIPKLKPISLNGKICDFSSVYNIPKGTKFSSYIGRNNAIDQENLPDRFIGLAGDEKAKYGIALGYSLLSGCTANKDHWKERETLYHFYQTKKMYPYSYRLMDVKPNKAMETVVYKQFFDPQTEPELTDFYWHYEGKSAVVYMDCHKSLKNKQIILPEELIGQTITVVEKTPSVTLHTQGKVTPEGLRFDVNENYGYFVLKLE